MKTLGIGLFVLLLSNVCAAASSKSKQLLWPEQDVKRPQISRMPASYEYSKPFEPTPVTTSVKMTVHRFDWQAERAVLIGIKVE